MIIVDPVALGDVACTRASTATYFDRNGVLQTAPANTLRVTYDPSDLSKAPYALVEPVATNLLWYSDNFGAGSWAKYGSLFGDVVMAPDGTTAADKITGNGIDGYVQQNQPATAGITYTASVWLRADAPVMMYLYMYSNDGVDSNRVGAYVTSVWQRFSFTLISTRTMGLTVQLGGGGTLANASVYLWGAQLEAGPRVTSYIPTAGAPATRAADVVPTGAGVVYSNVPITEPPYNVGATYAKDAVVYDPATYLTYTSMIAANTGQALTDPAKWLKGDVINRRKMLDQYNNTQTTNPDEILVVLSPQAISQGLYLGNLFADEVRISVVDQVEGLVYSATASLVVSTSNSSLFNWCFKRIKRKSYFLTLDMPVYANALVTICIRKIGGVPKAGMCGLGPVDEFGPTLMGLSTEGKDYSSTTFNFDGTSSTVIRPYAKRMGCDVMVDNDQLEYLEERLFELRQKPIVWVGGPYGNTAVFGRYGSFKNTIQYATRSLMNLTIEGAV